MSKAKYQELCRKQSLLSPLADERDGMRDIGRILNAIEECGNFRVLEKMLEQPDGPFAEYAKTAKFNLSEAIRHFKLAYYFLNNARDMYGIQWSSIQGEKNNLPWDQYW